MSITFTGQRGFQSGVNNTVLCGQTTCSVSFFLRYDGTAETGMFAVARQFYETFWAIFTGSGGAGIVKLQVGWAGASASLTVNLSIGAVYHIASTVSGGVARLYVNAVAQTIGTIGTTQSTNRRFSLGTWDFTPTNACVWTLSDVAVWNGYALTAQDVADLKNAVKIPLDITSGTYRGRWTCAGTVGTTPTTGQTGLQDGVGTIHMTQATGTGSAVYSDPLVWAPSARILEAHVGTSGKTIDVSFKGITSGSLTIPKTMATAPTLKKNGVSIGQCAFPWLTGTAQSMLLAFPAGQSAVPGDTITISAPVSWATTVAGEAEAVVDGPVTNFTGQSCFGTATLTKTLRPGYNLDGYYTAQNGQFAAFKNWRLRAGAFSGATHDATGKPISFATNNYAESIIYLNTDSNGIDATGMPGPTGIFAVQWDDLNTAVPTNFQLVATDYAATTTITAVTDGNNPGTDVGGGRRNGICKLFNVQRAAGSTTVQTAIVLQVSNSAKTPQFDNLLVYGPGDFTYAPGTPTVLDGSDPYALSSIFLQRFANGAGSIRSWPQLLGSPDCSMSEKEHVRTASTFCMGFMNDLAGGTIRYTNAYPFNQATTPWFYDPLRGSEYNATLTTGIDAVTTTLSISDAATAPVIVGLRLRAGTEKMRVMSVSGTTVTVQRGSDGTTAASHSAGTIQVQYRIATPTLATFNAGLGNCCVIQFETQSPHGLKSGTVLGFDSGMPNWSGLFTNGAVDTVNGIYMWMFAGPVFVTSPTGFLIHAGPFAGSTTGTLTAAQTLTPANHHSYLGQPNQNPVITYEHFGELATRIPGVDPFVNVGHLYTPDLVDQVARAFRDHFPSGRTVYVETTCEPWNFVPGVYYKDVSAILYPTENIFALYAKHSADNWKRFVDVFNEGGRNRGGEIRGMLNVHSGSPGVGDALMNFLWGQSPPVATGALGFAPYVDTSDDFSDSITRAVYSNYDADQCVDLWIHNLYHRAPTAIMSCWPTFRSNIDAFNTAHGTDTQLVCYEGGLQQAIPNMGQNNTPNKKARDFAYSPAFYYALQDFWALLQIRAGVERYNTYAFYYLYKFFTMQWGEYMAPFQLPGKGDGSDGKANNKNCLATTKAATVNQDALNVSVRGQAFIDYNGYFTAPAPTMGPSVSITAGSETLEIRIKLGRSN